MQRVQIRMGHLYDHLHQLQELLDRLGLQVSIPIEDAAIGSGEA